jgi:hypothetical protein
MRRTFLIGSLLAVAGCANFRDLFTAHAGEAAEAGSLTLEADRLGQLLTAGKGIQLNRETADYVANVWVDYALFAQSVVKGQVLTDSTTMAEAMWPEIAEMRGNRWHDSLLARRSPVGPGTADSVYAGNDVRVFQHLLIGTTQNAVPEERAKARKQAEAALARIKGGADFGKVAAEVSADQGSARDNGFLPPSARGAYVPAFDSAGWALAPGAMSGVVETQFGYHVIRRPPAAAVQERLLGWVRQNAGTKLDSLYMDSLSTVNKLEVDGNAAKSMKKALDDPEGERKSTKKITTFAGGGLTVGEFLRWVRALPPQYVSQIKAADEAALANFAKVLSTNVLLLRQADSAKVQLTPEEWAGLRERYRTQIDTLRSEMGLGGSDITDSTVAESERVKLAQLKLEEYFDKLIGGKMRIRPLPSTLGMVLRERSSYEVNDAGLNAALEFARAKQATDSSKAGPGGPPQPGQMQPGQMQPAPGPAPVPGGATPPAEAPPSQ